MIRGIEGVYGMLLGTPPAPLIRVVGTAVNIVDSHNETLI